MPPLRERHAGWDIGRQLATVGKPGNRIGSVLPVLIAGRGMRPIVHAVTSFLCLKE